MGKDYIPIKIAEYRRFSDHFVEVVSQKASLWGIPDTAKAKLTDGHAEWTQAQDEANNPETRTSITIEKAQRLRKEDTAHIRWMVNTYINPNALGTIMTEDRVDLELRVFGKTPIRRPAPVSRPDAEVVPSGKFRHTVTALNSATAKKEKPSDAYGVRFAWQVGGAPPASPADLPKSKFSRKPQTDFSWEPNDQGKPVHYAVCYENPRGTPGPWSAVVSTIVP